MSGAKYFDELRVVSFLVIYAGEGGECCREGGVGTLRGMLGQRGE